MFSLHVKEINYPFLSVIRAEKTSVIFVLIYNHWKQMFLFQLVINLHKSVNFAN